MSIFKVLIAFILFSQSHCISQTVNNIKKQEIIGVWQANSWLLGAGLQDIYRFYKDGKFVYQVSSYNYLSGVEKIEGIYSIEDSSITFNVNYVWEVVDGEIKRGDPGVEGDWILTNVKVKKIKQTLSSEYAYFKQGIDHKNEYRFLMIDGKIFYLISTNPDDEEFREYWDKIYK